MKYAMSVGASILRPTIDKIMKECLENMAV